MTLYEINAQLQQLIENAIDPETGELLISTDELDALELQREEKIENIALYIKDMNADAAKIKAEIDNLNKRRQSLTGRAERLTRYLADMLSGEAFATPRASITWRKSKGLEVDPAVFVEWAQRNGDAYLRFKDPEPDKKALTEALKSGAEIPGVEIVERNNMTIK